MEEEEDVGGDGGEGGGGGGEAGGEEEEDSDDSGDDDIVVTINQEKIEADNTKTIQTMQVTTAHCRNCTLHTAKIAKSDRLHRETMDFLRVSTALHSCQNIYLKMNNRHFCGAKRCC